MEMIEDKTAELIGPALDWATAKASGTNIDDSRGKELRIDIAPGFQSPWVPSVNWYQGGPLIDEYAISIMKPLFDDGIWIAERINETGEFHSGEGRKAGGTALIAMCRSLVSVLVGDTVSVPKELMQ